jgi:hypothetical protein
MKKSTYNFLSSVALRSIDGIMVLRNMQMENVLVGEVLPAL